MFSIKLLVLVHIVSPHQCVAFFCAVSQRIYSSVSLCVGLLKELETGLKQWHTQIANRSIALRVNSHIWIMGCQNDLPRQVGKRKETLRAPSRFFDPPLIRKKWMRQSSFPVVKPVFHWRAWSLEIIADYFRAHVTWQWRLLCSFNSLKVFQKAVKSALQTVNIAVTFQASRNHKQDLCSVFVWQRYVLLSSDRLWQIADSPNLSLRDFSQPLYLLTRKKKRAKATGRARKLCERFRDSLIPHSSEKMDASVQLLLVKPIFHWCAWSLTRIADYFRALVTW